MNVKQIILQSMIESQILAHRAHLKDKIKAILVKLFKKTELSSIIFSSRSKKIILSLLTQSEIYSTGFSKFYSIQEINPYGNYEKVVMAVTPECCKKGGEVEGISYLIESVYIINLNFSNDVNNCMKKLRELSFKGVGIKGVFEENLDFYGYLEDVYCLQQDSKKKEGVFEVVEDVDLMCDRLSSYLCSFPKFNEFCIECTQKSTQFAQKVKDNIESRCFLFRKHSYPQLDTSSSAIKVVIFERNQNISPFIHSLQYGPLLEELNIVHSTNVLSIHSKIFNRLYCHDLQSAALLLQNFSKEFSSSKMQGVTFNSFEGIKKDLMVAYNPDMTAEELRVHQEAFKQIYRFLQKNKKDIKLERDIANGIDERGRSVKGGKAVDRVLEWATGKKQSEKQEMKSDKISLIPYEYYLRLVMIALQSNNFWWFQRNQLISGLKPQHKALIKQFISKAKKEHLKEPLLEKDEDGLQIRSDFFRHQPGITTKIIDYLKGQTGGFQKIHVNKDQMNLKLKKESKTVIFVNGVLGYNELASIKKEICKIHLKEGQKNKSHTLPNNIELVCRNLMKTQEWTQFRLWQCLNKTD